MTTRCLSLCMLALAITLTESSASDVVFSDDFGQDGRLGRGWMVTAGDWHVSGGTAENAASGGGMILVGSPRWQDYTVEATLQTLRPGPRPWSVARVLFCHTNAKNTYYLLLHQNGFLELGKELRGTHIPGLAKANLDSRPTTKTRFKINIHQGAITVAVNGEQILAWQDPDPLFRGMAGVDAFQNSHIRVSDFRVSSATLAQKMEEEKAMAEELLDDVGYARNAKGNIAIFRDRDVPIKDSAPSDPKRLAQILSNAGYGVTFLTADNLANSVLLRPRLFDLVVFPYGAAFPESALETFRAYLRRGGSFLSTGGYFGDHLYGSEDAVPAVALTNPGFEEGLKGWRVSDPDVDGLTVTSEEAPGEGAGGVASIKVAPGTPLSFYSLEQRIDVPGPGTVLLLQARLRTQDIAGGAGAYMAINYYDENDERIRWDQARMVKGTRGWRSMEMRGAVPPNTAYATLNLLVHGHGQAWFDDVRIRLAGSSATCLNTREGDVKGPGNSLRVDPAQIGVFAPNYRLEDVAHIRGSAHQQVVSANVAFNLAATGYSASGLFIGNGNPVNAVQYARPVHLLDAVDTFGCLRGRAGALVRNYKGPYAGSDWAAFGVNKSDLFTPDHPPMAAVLVDTVKAMMTRLYIAEVHSELACCRQGESVRLQAVVANFADRELQATVRLTVRAEDAVAFSQEIPVTLAPGRLEDVEATWSPTRFETDYYTIEAELLADPLRDTLRNAFVVWDEDVIRKQGPRIEIGNGYLQRNGQPAFMCGTGDAGYPYHAESENPLVWDEQFRLMRDYGLRYYRCMHFMNGFPIVDSFDSLDLAAKKKLRRLDGIVYLAQKHGLMYLFQDNYQLQFTREKPNELAKRMRVLGLLAERYRDVPGFLFNSDHQEFIRGKNPRSHESFRRFLKERYGTPAKLAQAWERKNIASWDDVRLNEGAAAKAPWSSVISRDTGAFLDLFREDWRRNHADAVHAGHADTIVAQDFSLYWWPDFRWPAPDVMAKLDMVSAHFYGAEDGFLTRMKRCDMQVIGKPVGMTEFGIMTHSAWEGHRDARLDHDSAERFFMMATHTCLGLGGTMLSNWNWKEMKECIFPWSIAQQDLVPKAQFRAYRNAALLFRTLKPAYSPPPVLVVVPTSNLRLGHYRQVEDALGRWITDLLRSHVPFGMIGEAYLNHVPDKTRLLIYPLPYCPPDETVAGLDQFARNGGTLYISGDISFDEHGLRTKTDRLEQLCGVRFMRELRPPMDTTGKPDGSPHIQLEPTTAQTLVDTSTGPLWTRNPFGKGVVILNAEPTEAFAKSPEIALEAGTQAIAGYLLGTANVSPLAFSPQDPDVYIFRIADADGGDATILFNSAKTTKTITLTHRDRTVELTLGPRGTGFVQFDATGRLLAVEGTDTIAIDGQTLASGKGHIMLAALDNQDIVRTSQALLAMAVGECQISLRTPHMSAPTIEYGNFQNSRWHPFTQNDGINFNCQGPLRSAIALVCPAGRTPSARRAAEQRLQQ